MAKALKIRALLTALMGLLYGASPIDLLPDLIPVLGIVDDAILVPVLFFLAFLQWRRSKGVAARPPVPGSMGSGPVIDMPRTRTGASSSHRS